MSRKESIKLSYVLEHVDGRKLRVRGNEEGYSDGKMDHKRESIVPHILIPNGRRLGSVSSKTSHVQDKNSQRLSNANYRASLGSISSEVLRGRNSQLLRLSKSNFKTRYDINSLKTLLDTHQTSKYLKSLFCEEEHWVKDKKTFNDGADLSEHPSYTIKNISYNLECELLYMEAKEKYDSQFFREMEHIIASKNRISDQYFTKRLFSYTTLWPPLHTKRELDIFNKRFFQLSPAKRKRVDFLMASDLSDI